MSVTLLTNDKPIHSKSFSNAKSKSRKSFKVKHGKEIFVFGKFTPFFEDKVPPAIMVQRTSSLRFVSMTFKVIFPSSINTNSPAATSCGN